jgi:hypothetical protein
MCYCTLYYTENKSLVPEWPCIIEVSYIYPPTKTYMIEDFLHLPPVSLTPVANLELGIPPRIFEKIRNDPNGILRGMGETDS